MKVYEATMAKLMFGGATAQELSSVSRMQPDASLHVKALSGLGKLYALKLETGRLKLSEAWWQNADPFRAARFILAFLSHLPEFCSALLNRD